MGLAEYMIISKPDGWTVLHDGPRHLTAAIQLSMRWTRRVLYADGTGRDVINKIVIGDAGHIRP